MDVEILGVHPIKAPEPCHLVELEVRDLDAPFEIDAITQEAPGEPRENWQVPWDEHFLNPEGSAPHDPEAPDVPPSLPALRIAFFFHYLDLDRPLVSPGGTLALPPPTPRPQRLTFLRYESPC